MNSSIQPRIIQIIAEQLSLREADIKVDSRFVEDLGADSLDVVELIMEFEEEFGTEIPDEKINHMKIVRDVVDYISKQVS